MRIKTVFGLILATAAGLGLLAGPAQAQLCDGWGWAQGFSITGLIHGAERFIGVGDHGHVFLSDDGLDWTLLPSGAAADLLDVAFNGWDLVAVGREETIVTSADGYLWSAPIHDGGDGNGWYSAVVWGGGRFVAVGGRRHGSEYVGLAATSVDGSVWEIAEPEGLEPLSGVTWDGQRFLAVGSHGLVVTSRDGIEWTLSGRPRISASELVLRDVAFLDGRYVLIATFDIGSILLTSSDGEQWSEVTSTGGWLTRVVATETGFVAIGSYLFPAGLQAMIMTSDDGLSWSVADITSDSRLLYTAAVGDGQIVIAGDRGRVLTSSDGEHWTWRRSPVGGSWPELLDDLRDADLGVSGDRYLALPKTAAATYLILVNAMEPIEVTVELYRGDGARISTSSIALAECSYHRLEVPIAQLYDREAGPGHIVIRSETLGARYLAYAKATQEGSPPQFIPVQACEE